MKIAVVDSGINPSLPEFAGRIDPDSHDVASNRPLGDEDGHGTAVAATAAAARNDAQNMGVAFEATIIAYRADSPGSCASEDGCDFFDSAIAHGIDDARIAGARVINLSLGGSAPGNQLLQAMQRATNAGIVLVISAGNDGEDAALGGNADAFALVPAQNLPGQVIIAGALDGGLNQLASFSNRAGQGAQWYLAALGSGVRTIDETGAGFFYSGTSFSAPIISGAVALLADAFPNLTGAQIVDILFRSADDLGAAGTDATFGRGRLNIGRAMQPIGTTSLAGSAIPVTGSSTASGLPESAGDGGQGELGVIILDGYSRAYALDLARSLRSAPARQPLEQALSGHARGSSVTAGPLTVAMTVSERRGLRGMVDVSQMGIGPEDARRSRLVAGQVIARLDSKTRMALGIAESAKSLERTLNGARPGAFLIARDVSTDPGFQARRGNAMAVRRDLGFAGVTLSSEQGKVWQRIATRADESPYRWNGISLDRSFGRTWLSAGVSRLQEKETLLGGRLGAVYGSSGSSTLFLDLEARRELGSGWSAALNARRGWTDFTSGRFQTGAYGFDLSRRDWWSDGDRFGLRISQPLRIEQGGIAAMLPTGFDYSTMTASSSLSRLSFTPSGREIDAEVSYSRLVGKGWIGGNLFARRQPGHIASAEADLGAAIRYSLDF